MEVTGSTDIFMILREHGIQSELFRQLIPITVQDRLDLVESKQAFAVCDATGGVESLAGIGSTEIEQTETNPVRLLGMILGLELCGNPDQCFRSDIPSPVFESPWKSTCDASGGVWAYETDRWWCRAGNYEHGWPPRAAGSTR